MRTNPLCSRCRHSCKNKNTLQTKTIKHLVLVLSECVPIITLVSFTKTFNQSCFVLRIGWKPKVPFLVKSTFTLIVKRRGLPQCFWHGFLLTAPHYSVNPYKVLYKLVSKFKQSSSYLP